MAEWPPLLIYAVIALSVVIENFFPPSPSDVFVLLAAFLTRQGTMDPLTIFLVAWLFGVAGAVAVYWSSRRFGRRFFATAPGRRLITPGAFAAIEREYVRFGMAGIFIFRMLPAFRAVVSPFAGFVNLPARRAFPPIILACAVWYGGLTLLGSSVGANWGVIRRWFGRVNTGLGIVAGLALVALVLWFLRRRKARRLERAAADAPFDPAHPEEPAPMIDGLPVISVEALERARLARQQDTDLP
ncbi:MAG TPA: DedA family protein [Gemmatimonadales bacterium]|nr:DedA family protein [Gemmatimonadales bacterium]